MDAEPDTGAVAAPAAGQTDAATLAPGALAVAEVGAVTLALGWSPVVTFALGLLVAEPLTGPPLLPPDIGALTDVLPPLGVLTLTPGALAPALAVLLAETLWPATVPETDCADAAGASKRTSMHAAAIDPPIGNTDFMSVSPHVLSKLPTSCSSGRKQQLGRITHFKCHRYLGKAAQ